MSLIGLITDFGTRDWFVAAMKGVILGIDDQARIIDITHEIAPGDIAAAAFVLRESLATFPAGAVLCAVVDPGVGSARAAIAARAGAHVLVGPDNGVLSYALMLHDDAAIYRLENPAFFRTPVSATFHGRDIFAPVSAHLNKGAALDSMGPRVHEYVRLAWPRPDMVATPIIATIIYVDRFGNAFTNITESDLAKLAAKPSYLAIGTTGLIPVATHYAQIPSGSPGALINASGYLEIAINGGNASEQLHLRAGSTVLLYAR